MKKIILLLMVVTLILSLSFTVSANDEITVKLNGNEISFDVPPQLINGRTMVPLRAIFEALNATVEWEDATQTVTSKRDDTTISLAINDPTMYVNGVAVTLDSPACLVGGRTLVPVRAISEAFGILVEWDEDTKTVLITSFEDLKIGVMLAGAMLCIDTMPESTNKSLQLCVSHNGIVDLELEYNRFFTWESSDSSIAEVENGLVNVKSQAGLVTIKATSPNGIVLEQKINVTQAFDEYYEKFRNSFQNGLEGYATGDVHAHYIGRLSCEDFLEEFSYRSTNWNRATEKFAKEIVMAQNSEDTDIYFWWSPNGSKSYTVHLGWLSYDESDDSFSHYWESVDEIMRYAPQPLPEDVDLNDTEGPQITILSINPNPAKLGEKVTVRAKITDTNGVKDAYVQLCNSAGNVAGGYLKLVEGDSKDGIYEGTFLLPLITPVGEWEADIYTEDILGNNSNSWRDPKRDFTVKAK